MFSAKNYGLPKDLIEAAKRVHEKQLEEQQKPTSLGQAAERVGLAVQGVIPKKANKPSAKDVYKAMGGTEPKRAKKPQDEEVQFTEEELAEAFAIFLEENFHVEMLTEEDLDYVFEEEFPQWLEEQMTKEEWLEYPLNERSLSASNQQEQLRKMGLFKTSAGKIADAIGGKGRDRIKGLVRDKQLRKEFLPPKKADLINTPRGRNLNTSDVTTKSAKRSADGAVLTKKQQTKSQPRQQTKSQPSQQPRSQPQPQIKKPRPSAPTSSSAYKPQSRIMKDTGAAAPDFGNNNATFDAENKPVFKSDTETRRAANLRTISKRKRRTPTRRAPTRRSTTRQSTGLPDWAKKAFTSEN